MRCEDALFALSAVVQGTPLLVMVMFVTYHGTFPLVLFFAALGIQGTLKLWYGDLDRGRLARLVKGRRGGPLDIYVEHV